MTAPSKECRRAGSICGRCATNCGCCRSSIAFRCAAAKTRDYLASFLPAAAGAASTADYRAGIDTSRYDFQLDGREPFTLLFLGSFRHLPNQEALQWFVRRRVPEGSRSRAARAADRDRLRPSAARIRCRKPTRSS